MINRPLSEVEGNCRARTIPGLLAGAFANGALALPTVYSGMVVAGIQISPFLWTPARAWRMTP